MISWDPNHDAHFPPGVDHVQLRILYDSSSSYCGPGAAYIVLLDARNVRQQQVPLDCAIPWNPLELSRYIIHISCSQVSEAKSISRALRSQKGIVSTPLLRLQQADRGIPGRGRSCHWSKNSPRRTDVLHACHVFRTCPPPGGMIGYRYYPGTIVPKTPLCPLCPLPQQLIRN